MSATTEKQELILLNESPYDTPNPHSALEDPEGLSAIGGDLSAERLLHLYSKGFFPWFSDPDPILWWHPKERCVLFPDDFHIAKSLKKTIKKENWCFSVNQAFDDVIGHCASLRADKEGTWISEDIKNAYKELHHLNYAHSIEVWLEGHLVGGFYGVAMGKQFFGESMFSLTPNASKVALKTFCELAKKCGIQLIDCQVESDHLLSLGAQTMPREIFCRALEQNIPEVTPNLALINIGKNTEKTAIYP